MLLRALLVYNIRPVLSFHTPFYHSTLSSIISAIRSIIPYSVLSFLLPILSVLSFLHSALSFHAPFHHLYCPFYHFTRCSLISTVRFVMFIIYSIKKNIYKKRHVTSPTLEQLYCESTKALRESVDVR